MSIAPETDESLRRALFVTVDGDTLPVTHLFGADERGASTPVQSLAQALTFVAGPRPNGKWIAGPTAAYTFSEVR